MGDTNIYIYNHPIGNVHICIHIPGMVYKYIYHLYTIPGIYIYCQLGDYMYHRSHLLREPGKSLLICGSNHGRAKRIEALMQLQ